LPDAPAPEAPELAPEPLPEPPFPDPLPVPWPEPLPEPLPEPWPDPEPCPPPPPDVPRPDEPPEVTPAVGAAVATRAPPLPCISAVGSRWPAGSSSRGGASATSRRSLAQLASSSARIHPIRLTAPTMGPPWLVARLPMHSWSSA
jgi:hypothetical protein